MNAHLRLQLETYEWLPTRAKQSVVMSDWMNKMVESQTNATVLPPITVLGFTHQFRTVVRSICDPTRCWIMAPFNRIAACVSGLLVSWACPLQLNDCRSLFLLFWPTWSALPWVDILNGTILVIRKRKEGRERIKGEGKEDEVYDERRRLEDGWAN